MNRRRLILAGGTVAFTAIGVVRRYRRPPRGPQARCMTPVVVAIPLVPLLLPGWYGWDQTTFWASRLWSFFGGVAGEVRDFVLEAIDHAVTFVLDALHLVEDGLDRTLDLVFGTIDLITENVMNVAAAVGDVIVETTNRIEGTFQWIRQQVKEAIDAAWVDLKTWILEPIKDGIHDALGDFWDLLVAVKNLGTDGIGLLLDFVRDPIGFIWDLISDLVRDAIDVALGEISVLLDALVKLWDIIVWLGEHVDEFTPGALQAILDPSWQSIQQDIVDTVDENIDSFEKLVRKVFGLGGDPINLGPIIGPQGP